MTTHFTVRGMWYVTGRSRTTLYRKKKVQNFVMNRKYLQPPTKIKKTSKVSARNKESLL